MLFDLRGRGRRRTVQVIYLSLALLMGGGLVLFGIGSDAGQGGLVDGIAGSGGSASGAIEDRAERAQEATQRNPRDARAWAVLARERYQLAASTAQSDPQSGQTTFDEEGRAELGRAAEAWQRHLQLAGDRPDAESAAVIANLYGDTGLNQPSEAARAWNIVVDSREDPSAGDFARLAQYQYAAGNTREGDLAARAAVRETPSDQRRDLRTQLDQIKASALTGQAQGAAGAAGASPAPISPAPATP
jgi:hypothetical protein